MLLKSSFIAKFFLLFLLIYIIIMYLIKTHELIHPRLKLQLHQYL